MPENNALFLDFKPVTREKWSDFAALFGERGACGGCWCMTWRLKRSDFEAGKAEKNRATMKEIILSEKTPGILAYDGDLPIAWCSIAPREDFSFLSRSRILAPVDDKPVWSISCIFILKNYQMRGISTMIISAASEFAREKRAEIVEAYPYDLKGGKLPPPFVWTGLASTYIKAGFSEAARRSPKRPIMRKYL